MLAVIMAGGEGSRLRPLTCTLPKPMVPLCNKPVMEHILALVNRHGFRDAVATLFAMPDQIKDHFGSGMHGVSLRYSIEDKPLGTAGSVKFATGANKKTFLVISGDVMTDVDLSALLEFHKSKGAVATLALTQVQNPLEFGVVLTDSEGRITGFLEKPGWGEVFSDLVNTGIYVLEPEVMDLVPPGKPFDFSKDLYPRLLREGYPMYALNLDGYWCDIGTVDQYRKANADCLMGRIRTSVPGRQIAEHVWVEDGACIHPSARLTGPVLVGKGAQIGAGCVIGPGTVIGHNAQVGSHVKIDDSILWDSCRVEKRATIRGSVVSSGCTVGYRATLEHGAVLGRESSVGKYCTVWRSVKLWPRKNAEDKAFVTSSVVWSDKGPRTLFGRHGISGLANTEITPEICTRVASAFAVGVPKVILSCADDGVSQMLGAASMAGAQSSGAEVLTADNTLPPVLRLAARQLRVNAIRVESPPTRPGMVDCTYYDQNGLNISRDAQRKIESALAREDYPKATAEDVRLASPLKDYSAQYIDALLSHVRVNSDLLSPPRVLIEAPFAEGRLLRMLLDRLGVDYVMASEGTEFSPVDLVGLGCSFGISVMPEGESLSILLPEDGYVAAERLHALLGRAWAELCPDNPLALPVSEPLAVRKYAESHGAKVTLVKSTPRAILEHSPFSYLQDAYSATALLEGLMAKTRLSIRDLVRDTPEVHFVRKTVLCPWEMKGKVMRRLATDPEAKTGIEGVETQLEDSRVLVLPHAEEAVYELFVEASSWEIADEIGDVYAEKIRSMVNREQ